MEEVFYVPHFSGFRPLLPLLPTNLSHFLTGLELTLYAGDHVALLGVNGSGKTTLLELLSGTLTVAKRATHHAHARAALPTARRHADGSAERAGRRFRNLSRPWTT